MCQGASCAAAIPAIIVRWPGSPTSSRAFRKQLAPFVEHARKAGRGQRRLRASSTRQRSGDIRAWAKQQGIAVSYRGRIPLRWRVGVPTLSICSMAWRL